MFWRQTVLPLAWCIGHALTQRLAPSFGAELTLTIHTDAIEASPDRAALWDWRHQGAVPVDQKRAATGYGTITGGDVVSLG